MLISLRSSCLAITVATLVMLQPSWLLADQEPFTLVRDRQPVASVVYAGSDPLISKSVQDLSKYVEKISGARLRVIQGQEDLPGPTLHIGETALFGHLSAAIQKIQVDGFAMAKVGEDLIVAGKIPQGTANGVITILQDQFGVRWYYGGPLWEVVPATSTLSIKYSPNVPNETCIVNPSFIERSLWGGASSQDFGRHSRLTLKGVNLPYVGTGHNLSRVVNPAKFSGHPEYFAYWDGKHHVEADVHPCFTHPDMPKIFLDYVLAGNSSLGVNDNLTACRCERCLRVDGNSAPYMGMVNVSESYFQLISKVAREAASSRPGTRLGVFAYQLTNAPPKTVDYLGDNVDVVLCQDTAQYFDPAYRKIDQEMSADWVKKCGHVRFYDYIGINFWVPRYFPHILADQLKHLRNVGVAGYGTHSQSMIDSSMPMYYLLYRLLWDADLDPDVVINEMITDLYGEAADPVHRFYDHWENCWQRQKNGKWFFGMDNFIGEMSIFKWTDFETGRRLLEEAASMTRREKVRKRVAYLQDRYAFTYESAKVFTASTAALEWKPGDDYEAAIDLSNKVVDAWRSWADCFEKTLQLDGTPMSDWISKPTRVRIWGLKQQVRDAVVAPMVRWVCANEGCTSPAELRRREHIMAGVGMLNRSTIENRVTEQIDAVPYPPRVFALLVSDVPRAQTPPRLDAARASWQDAGALDAAPWVFLDQGMKRELGKYEDPVDQHHRIMDRPPVLDDLSVMTQSKWDDQHLYLRIQVRDERHVQSQPSQGMWKEDSVRIALNPDRANYQYADHSWTYIWGGYRGCELDFGVSLNGDKTLVHVDARPADLSKDMNLESLIRATARQNPPCTVYEIAIDWRCVPGFKPTREKSLGIWISVYDKDQNELVSAEYGSSMNRVKRPTEFSAIRLVD